RLAFLAFLVAVIVGQPGALDHMLDQYFQRQRIRAAVELVDQHDEALQRARRARGQLPFLQHRTDRRPQRDAALTRALAHRVQRPAADAARRRVDHALDRGVIAAIEQQAQVGERIANFQPLVETLAAVDAVRNAAAY